MPGRLLLLLLPLAALTLVAPAGAHAAAGEVRVAAPWESDGDIREDYSYRVRQLRYVGAPGKASNLTVRFGKAGRATLSDPGGVRAGKGCRQAGPNRVRCRARGRKPVENAGARFVLGQGDDALRLRGIPRTGTASIAGGAGDDRIQGSAGADAIFPGAGDDQVAG